MINRQFSLKRETKRMHDAETLLRRLNEWLECGNLDELSVACARYKIMQTEDLLEKLNRFIYILS